MMQQARFVLHIPARRLEEGRNKVHARLGFKIILGSVVVLVGLEFSDGLFEVRLKGGNGHEEK